MEGLAHIEHRNRRNYAAMVVEMDRDVGRMMDRLAEHGLTRDTLVFFFSDNGGPQPGEVTDNLPFRDGKGSVYEGGIHVPFIASWPGTLPAGTSIDFPVTGIDITRTAADLAGAGTDRLEGANLLPYLTGEADGAPQEYIFFRRRDGAAWAVIDKEGKKLVKPRWQTKEIELYDLTHDPGETNDLYAVHPEEAARLQAAYDQWDTQNIRYTFLDYADYEKKLDAFHDTHRK